jgi:hypothetical protein
MSNFSTDVRDVPIVGCGQSRLRSETATSGSLSTLPINCQLTPLPGLVGAPDVFHLFNVSTTAAAGRRLINYWRSADIIKASPQYVDSLIGTALTNYQAYQASPLFDLYSAVSDYRDSLSAAQPLVNSYSNLRISHDSLVILRDSILFISDSLTFSQQSQVNILTTLINNKATSMGSLFGQYQNKFTNATNLLNASIYAIMPADIAEQATADYLKIAVDGLLGNGYDNTDIADINTLANQCVDDYGLAVFGGKTLGL